MRRCLWFSLFIFFFITQIIIKIYSNKVQFLHFFKKDQDFNCNLAFGKCSFWTLLKTSVLSRQTHKLGPFYEVSPLHVKFAELFGQRVAGGGVTHINEKVSHLVQLGLTQSPLIQAGGKMLVLWKRSQDNWQMNLWKKATAYKHHALTSSLELTTDIDKDN